MRLTIYAPASIVEIIACLLRPFFVCRNRRRCKKYRYDRGLYGDKPKWVECPYINECRAYEITIRRK